MLNCVAVRIFLSSEATWMGSGSELILVLRLYELFDVTGTVRLRLYELFGTDTVRGERDAAVHWAIVAVVGIRNLHQIESLLNRK